MDCEISTCKDFFSNALTPTNYPTVVTNIKTFIDTNVRRSRRIVLVTVSISVAGETEVVGLSVGVIFYSKCLRVRYRIRC